MSMTIRLISRKFLETEAFTKDLDTPPVGGGGVCDLRDIRRILGMIYGIRKIRDLSRFWYGFREIRFRSAAGGKFWDSDPFRNAFLTLTFFKCGAKLTLFSLYLSHLCTKIFAGGAKSSTFPPLEIVFVFNFGCLQRLKKYDF